MSIPIYERVIPIEGNIGRQKIQLDISTHISRCIKKDPHREIIFDINSDGGSAYFAYYLIDFLAKRRVRATSHGGKRVSSAAILLYLYGRRRYALEETCFFFHNPSPLIPTTEWTPAEYEAAARRYAGWVSRSIEVDPKRIRELMDQEVTLTAEEARLYGIVHTIL